jgi:15-cis-phytoene synthase
MRFQIDRAREYYRKAQPGIPMLHHGGRFSVQIASDVYAAILNEIERSDYEVFRRRAVVPARQKYWITARRITRPMISSLWTRFTGATV